MHWNTLVIIICVPVAVFAVLKEYRRGNKQRLALRIAASLVSIAALAAIILPITYNSEINKPVNEAVLLTPGFNKDSLNRFKTDTIYTTDAAIKNTYPKAKLITINELKKVTPAIAHLHILGYGLKEFDIKQLDSIPVIFNPGPYPNGVTAISWPSALKQGEPFTLQGKYNHTKTGQVRLILKELNTTVDSATIEQQGNTSFQLGSLPKSTGRIVDRLIILNGGDTIENESLPLIIEPVQPLKILMLAAAPGFENKFLKNWLVEKGFGVAVRSAISKDKFSTEFTSMPALPLIHLSNSVLAKFDILIADQSALKTLNPAEQVSLKQEVSQNALGLIIKADTVFKTGGMFQTDFPVYKALVKDQKPLPLQIQGAKTASKVTNSGLLFISYKEGTQTLVKDAQNRLLAGVSLAGSGKVVCTTLDNTYTWMLAGNKNDYAEFWSLLIGKAAKTIPMAENWSTINPYPTINMPETVQLETAQQPGQIIVDYENSSPVQNGTLPFVWQSTFWAAKAGWLSINHTGGTNASLYIYNPADWATIKAVNTSSATKKHALSTTATGVTKQIQQKLRVLIPKAYFYMLLLLCCTFLWVEDKLPAVAT